MDLQISHLAPYLPFGLTMIYQEYSHTDIPILKSEKMVTLDGIYVDDQKIRTIELYDIEKIWMFKPILKPLCEFGNSDDLRKVHEFIGIGKWCDAYDEYFKAWFNDAANIDRLVLQAPYEVFMYFLANHYDVFSLIPNNLAIAEKDSLFS